MALLLLPDQYINATNHLYLLIYLYLCIWLTVKLYAAVCMCAACSSLETMFDYIYRYNFKFFGVLGYLRKAIY